MLIFDHGERRSGVPAELERLGVDVHGTRLPAGDYVLSDRLVVERKGPADLAASIKDRRIFEQLARLAEVYPSVVLIVEGEPVHMREAAWLGALGRALTLGASVLRTRDAQETAEWIARLYRLEGKPASAPRGTPRVRRPTDDDLQTAEDVLRCLPGISAVGAGRLLAHFGSLERVFAAGRKELLEVRGIGPVRARTLDRLFRTTAPSQLATPRRPAQSRHVLS
jgi:DNA excision repair protein ERCC-4